MKKSVVSLLLFLFLFMVPWALTSKDVVMWVEMSGHGRLTATGPNCYVLNCDPPFDVRCVTFVFFNDGTWGVEFGGEPMPIENDFEIVGNTATYTLQ